MHTISKFHCDLKKLKNFSNKLASKVNFGDIILLQGELGVGKTTFARFFINSLFEINNLNKPVTIRSPSFPILINYPLLNNEIYHYDLYRIEDKNELSEIELLEDPENNIFIIEWPEIILDNYKFTKFYLIQFEFADINNRKVILKHTHKKKF